MNSRRGGDKPPSAKSARWVAAAVDAIKGCEAAKAVEGLRFLASEAPKLPLPACSKPENCRCRYRKYPDRRQDDRREGDELGLARPRRNTGQDRRNGRGRRAVD